MRIGVFLIAIVVTWLLLAVLRGRLHPVGGLGVALGCHRAAVPGRAAVVPAVGDHPAGGWATRPRFRTTTIAVTLVIGIFGPTANGDRFTLFQIVLATVASTGHRAHPDRADLLPAAVAQAARPRWHAGGTAPAEVVETDATGAADCQARRLR